MHGRHFHQSNPASVTTFTEAVLLTESKVRRVAVLCSKNREVRWEWYAETVCSNYLPNMAVMHGDGKFQRNG